MHPLKRIISASLTALMLFGATPFSRAHAVIMPPQLITEGSIAGNAALDALKQEYNGASCNARRMYVSGKIIGTAMTFFIPTKSLSIAEKLKATRWAKALAKVDPVAKWLAYVSQTTQRLEVLARELNVLLFLPMDRIAHIIFGEFDELGRFTGGGLHSFHSLREAVVRGRIQVRDFATKQPLGLKELDKIKGPFRVEIKVPGNPPNRLWEEKSIFPKEWSNEDILHAINTSYREIMKNKDAFFVERSANSYRFIVKDITINLYIDDVIIKSGFPFITSP